MTTQFNFKLWGKISTNVYEQILRYSQCSFQMQVAENQVNFKYNGVSKTPFINGMTRVEHEIPMSIMASKTLNPIRRMVDQLKLEPNPNKQMIPLSIGDPTIFGNLKCDTVVTEAVVDAVRSGKYNGYAPAVGYEESRKAIAEYSSCYNFTVTSNDVIITSGCSSALEHCFLVIANPGDNVLIPRPAFPLYKTLCEASDIQCKYYNLLPDQNWEIDLVDMELSIDSKTVAIVINNPSNPCGSVYTREHLIEVLKIAELHRLPVIADEIYSFFTFGSTTFEFMASLNKNVPVLSCNGLTKRFICPGWRLGWIVIYDENGRFKKIRQGLADLATRTIGANTLVQGALPTILTKVTPESYKSSLDIVKNNLLICQDYLNDAPGLRLIEPQGAMYAAIEVRLDLFPDFDNNEQFIINMVKEQSVFCLPLEPFGLNNYFRILLTLPSDKMREACERIREYCCNHVKCDVGVNQDS